jgi:hypothetical protein
MTTIYLPFKPLSTARTISSPLALASLIFMGSTCAAQAATVADYSRMINGSCDYPMMCTGNNISSPMQYMQLAQQEDADIAASPDQEENSAPAENSQAGYPTMLWEDTKHVLGAPARWDDQEWKDMGWTALGVLGVMAVLDRPVQDAMRRIAPDDDQLTPNDNLFLLEIERFGREYSLGLLGGFYVVGALSDDETAIAVAQDGLTSVILASGVITSAIKIATGRARPRQDLGTADFNPLGGNDSFPSGHSTHAFAIASVIANHYDETWITYSSYGVASLVGLARSYHGGHFASDILAGGIIGTMVGKSVVEYNKPMRANKMVLMPEVAPGTVGIRMVSGF